MKTIKFALCDFDDDDEQRKIEFREVSEQDLAKAVVDLWAEQQGEIEQSQIYPPEGFHEIFDRGFYEQLCGEFSMSHGYEPTIRVREMREEGWLVIHCRYCGEADPKLEDHWLFCARSIEDEKPGHETRLYRYIPIQEPFSIDPKDGTILITAEDGDIYPYPPFKDPWPSVIFHKENYAALGMVNRLLKPSDSNPLTMLIRSGKQPYKGLAKQLIGELRKISRELSFPLPFEYQ